MTFVTQESEAWMRLADRTGHALPVPITDAAEHVAAIDAKADAVGPIPTVPATYELIEAGTSLEDAPGEQRRLDAEAARIAQMHADLDTAGAGRRNQLNGAVLAHRDELILGIRPAIADLIEQARPMVAAGYHDRDAVLAGGDAKALKGFRALSEMEDTFGLYLSAWRWSYQAAIQEPGAFDVRELSEGFVFWERPDLVRDDALAGRALNARGYPRAVEPTLAGIAVESPECGFRPALVSELHAIHDALMPRAIAAGMPTREFGLRAI